jgi:predicted transcriptional regulator
MSNKTPICIELTAEERAELECRSRALRAPHRAVVRAKAILLLAAGQTVSSVAREVGRERRHVRKWASRFERKRLQGLEDAPHSGRPARFSPRGGDTLGQAGLRAA